MELDNQQPSISQFELGWLCGAIDGEGCIGIWRRGGNRNDFKPGIRVANTSKQFIDKFCLCLNYLGVAHHITHYKSKDNRKENWTITIEGFKRIQNLLPIIKDLLIVKSQQANLVHEFILKRTVKWHRSEYDDRELEIVELLSKLNFRGVEK